MKNKFIVLLFLLIVVSLSCETMILHTNSGDYVFDVSEIDEITFSYTDSNDDFIDFMKRVPIKFLNNFPNPFNPQTTINFELLDEGKTTIDIFNTKGQKVRRILNENLQAGRYNFLWDGKDRNGRKVTSGVYFCKVTSNGKEKINKMLLLK